MPAKVFNYDTFISYKGEEESWAKRLANTLRSFGLKVWRDKDGGNGLRLGEQWNSGIRDGIRSSRTMVVLWSKSVQGDANSIVHQEINEMRAVIEADETGDRRFIPISLDGVSPSQHPVLGIYHADDLSFAALYQEEDVGKNGAGSVNAIDWYAAVRPLTQALNIKDVMEVRFVVAAMNRKQAEELKADPQTHALYPTAFDSVTNAMSHINPYDVERYGTSPNDWRPFPQLPKDKGANTIPALLDWYDSEKRDWMQNNNEFGKWILVSYSDQLMSDDAAVRQEAQKKIQEGPCLMILDPVSLIHKTVHNRIVSQVKLPGHPSASVIGVAPYVPYLYKGISKSINDAEQTLENLLEVMYKRFRSGYEGRSNVCVLGIDHELQFARWLQIAADRIVLEAKTPLSSAGIHRTQAQRTKGISRGPSARIVVMAS